VSKDVPMRSLLVLREIIFSPAPGGGTTASAHFVVTEVVSNPVPTIGAINPTELPTSTVNDFGGPRRTIVSGPEVQLIANISRGVGGSCIRRFAMCTGAAAFTP
jgi:hypothetical protein